jgi:hypothetical protein
METLEVRQASGSRLQFTLASIARMQMKRAEAEGDLLRRFASSKLKDQHGKLDNANTSYGAPQMSLKNGTPYYNPCFDDRWKEDFFAYMAEKHGAIEHWSSLIFGGNPSVLAHVAFLALDVPVDTLELSRENLRAFAATIPTKISTIRSAAKLISAQTVRLCL